MTNKELHKKALSAIGMLHMVAIENATGINESDPEVMEGCAEDCEIYEYVLKILNSGGITDG